MINGWVENRNDGVHIHAEAPGGTLQGFIQALAEEAPEASEIRAINTSPSRLLKAHDFQIRKSSNASLEITEISPDIAVCPQCLEDMKTQPHRRDYPFINCTNCGPRFTIISDLPYDREKTTMQVFPMCPQCRSEYENIMDRRFHAQPVACNHCGPHYKMQTVGQSIEGIQGILSLARLQIGQGKILAIKGLGGFHLACDAFNATATHALRKRKNRDGKPFAVMFRDIESLESHLKINQAERAALLSWHRPIVILNNLPGASPLAQAVSNGFTTTGAMLPYMPFHFLLFEELDTPAIVLTSGNISDEPVLIDNEKARQDLDRVADSFITYNRDILNRTDDSVMMVVNEKERMIRRSRGYVPSPFQLGTNTEGIFAAGAELVNCFGIGKGSQAILSQHIGDLKNLETLEFYEEAVKRFEKMFRFQPEIFVVDMHPDYLSRKYCTGRITDPSILTEVQHHHAHIASCMAEHGLDEQVIGVCLDGVGYGTDGNIWGFELMRCDLMDFQRELHPEYIAQPGGDLTTKEPWRMGLSYLYKEYGKEMKDLELPFLNSIDHNTIDLVTMAIDRGLNTPLTCSAGRLFDAVSAITNLCTHSDFHAEAPMRLEQVAVSDENRFYKFLISGNEIITGQTIRSVVEEVINQVPVPVISARFHNTVIKMILDGCRHIHQKTGIRKVVLSGGSFQNRYLLEKLERSLALMGLNCFSHEKIPSNDGGIALGQIAIGAKRRSRGKI